MHHAYIIHMRPSFRYDPQTNQWSSDVAPTSSCRTSVGVAVLDGFLYAVGGQDGVSCLNFVEKSVSLYLIQLLLKVVVIAFLSMQFCYRTSVRACT